MIRWALEDGLAAAWRRLYGRGGGWLKLVGSGVGADKLARSVLRHIRVASKQELKHRLMAAVEFFNGDPVVHTLTYKLDKAA
jgi:hypothetical protein